MIRIEAIEMTDAILEKLASKHAVSWDEVEEVCFSDGCMPGGGKTVFSSSSDRRMRAVICWWCLRLARRGYGRW